MSIQAPMSWIEQFMNWYPRNTKLYRRRSKTESDMLTNMKAEFDELKPFFMKMADAIWFKAIAKERKERLQLAQVVLECSTIEQAHALARQAALEATNG